MDERPELDELREEVRALRARLERLEPKPALERATRRGALALAAGGALAGRAPDYREHRR